QHCNAKGLLAFTRLGFRRGTAVCIIQRTAGYGPVCPVVWEGRSREASPYPDRHDALQFRAPHDKNGRVISQPTLRRAEPDMLRIENLVFDAWGRRFFNSASVTLPA